MKASLHGIKIDISTEARPMKLTAAQEAAAEAAMRAAVERKRQEASSRG